ncbi:hypothetical protein ES703_33710 [subsurface metagenome]
MVKIVMTREGWVEFLVRSMAVPVMAPWGGICFRRLGSGKVGKHLLGKQMTKTVVESLGLKTKEDCRLLREEIKRRISA